MIRDPNIRKQAYQYFLEEAPGLLEKIEEELFALLDKDGKERKLIVNNLMRGVHTLKGGAANVSLEAIKSLAHSFEDILKALYNPDLVITIQIQELLFQYYEAIRLLLSKYLSGCEVDDNEVIKKATSIYEELNSLIGNYKTQETFPCAEELGIDLVEYWFETVIPEKLEELSIALTTRDIIQVRDVLAQVSEIFLGLGESLNLPGFKEIANTTLTALNCYPSKAIKIAEIALANWQEARELVIKGDRILGGQPFAALLEIISTNSFINSDKIDCNEIDSDLNLEESEADNLWIALKKFGEFLDSNDGISSNINHEFYLNGVKCILGWFYQYFQIPLPNLNLSLLIPNFDLAEIEIQEELNDWIFPFLKSLKTDKTSRNIFIYRYWTILEILLAVAKFLAIKTKSQDYQNLPVIYILQQRRYKSYQAYCHQSPVSFQEENYLETIAAREFIGIIDAFLESNFSESEDDLKDDLEDDISDIWEKEYIFQEIETQREYLDKNQGKDLEKSDFKNFFNSYIKNQPHTRSIDEEKDGNLEQNKRVSTETVRVKIEGLEQLNYLIGELLIHQNKKALKEESIDNYLEQLLNKLKENYQVINQLKDVFDWMLILPDYKILLEALSSQLIPSVLQQESLGFNEEVKPINYHEIPEKLKTISDKITETIIFAENLKLINSESHQNLKKQQHMLFQIRDELIEARMSPIRNILNRFIPLVERLKVSNEKDVNLKLSGGHILIDKAIEEKLYDPLLHLVRNAFDHGIESPQLRHKLGKSETGKIEICAYNQGGQNVIEVRDDGGGLDFDKIRKRAIDLNFITPEIAQEIPEEKLLEFLFEPGFSTKEEVTDISGRGIGLDVVRSQIEALKGKIGIESSYLEGTTFSLQIPLTLSIAKLMVCEADGIIYALLPDVIEKIVLPKASEIRIFEGKKIFYWQTEKENYTIIVKKLSDLIKYKRIRKSYKPEKQIIDEYLPILLLRKGEEFIGLEVDEVFGEEEMVIRPIGSAIAPPLYIYGCSILKSTKLTLVIDAKSLIESTQVIPESETQKAYLSKKYSTLPSNLPKELLLEGKKFAEKVLLVVEDSLSMRLTLVDILEKAGYTVLQAGDGSEALQVMNTSNVQIDLILCDLEMPRMNGFEFLRELNKNQGSEAPPVMMLTSRHLPKYKEIASQLGVVAYCTKPYQEDELLQTIASQF